MKDGMRVHPSSMYLQLVDGHDETFDGASRLRRVAVLCIVIAILVMNLLYLFGPPVSTPLPWKIDDAMADEGPGGNSGPGGGDDDDGDGDDVMTDGNTDLTTDQATGNESVGNTDAGGQDTGTSTAGETDPGDTTGKSEATEGTGQESQGATDAPGNHTGASTAGETDPGDHTGKTEAR
jgi:hypothetical protein